MSGKSMMEPLGIQCETACREVQGEEEKALYRCLQTQRKRMTECREKFLKWTLMRKGVPKTYINVVEAMRKKIFIKHVL